MTDDRGCSACGPWRRDRRPLPRRWAWAALVLAMLPWSVGLAVGCGDDPQFQSASKETTVTVAGERIRVDLCLDENTRRMGMMHRTSVPADEGMLFVFPDVAPRRFWMRNTLVGLDIMFLHDDGTLINVEEAPPGIEEPGFFSDEPCRLVLELRKGWCADHGVVAGDVIGLPDDLEEWEIQ